LIYMVPTPGFEPKTYSLRSRRDFPVPADAARLPYDARSMT
jgi:hypothetical protein